jgi:hypothetical protein
METNVISKPGSRFDGKTLKEVLEMIKDMPPPIEDIERAKQLIERAGGGEKLRLAMFGEKKTDRLTGQS